MTNDRDADRETAGETAAGRSLLDGFFGGICQLSNQSEMYAASIAASAESQQREKVPTYLLPYCLLRRKVSASLLPIPRR